MFRYFIIFILFIHIISCQFSSCSYTDSNNCFYNLSSLAIPSNSSISSFYNITDGNSQYFVNICNSLNTNLLNCSENSGVCQNETTISYSCGLVVNANFSDYNGTSTGNYTCPGVSLSYFNGSLCANNSNRSTTIHIGCTNDSISEIISVNEESCSYYMQMYSKEACGNIILPSNSSTVTPTSLPSNITITPSITPSNITTPSILPSNITVTASISPSNTTITPSISTSTSATNNYDWVWWTLGCIGIVIIVVIIAIIGYVVYRKKKNPTYDTIGYE